MGKDIESLYVEELGGTLSREELLKVLVLDIMEGAIEVDWRDFFPYLKWVPNKTIENKIQRMCFRRKVVMDALIKEQKKRIASGEVVLFFLSFRNILFINLYNFMTHEPVTKAGAELLYRLLAFRSKNTKRGAN